MLTRNFELTYALIKFRMKAQKVNQVKKNLRQQFFPPFFSPKEKEHGGPEMFYLGIIKPSRKTA